MTVFSQSHWGYLVRLNESLIRVKILHKETGRNFVYQESKWSRMTCIRPPSNAWATATSERLVISIIPGVKHCSLYNRRQKHEAWFDLCTNVVTEFHFVFGTYNFLKNLQWQWTRLRLRYLWVLPNILLGISLWNHVLEVPTNLPRGVQKKLLLIPWPVKDSI